MASVNRYFTPQRGNYVSQYADYSLPQEAIQNSVLQRQNRFDVNQAMPAQYAQKFGDMDVRPEDAPAVQKMLGDYLSGVNSTVNDKYNGDFSLAAGDIYDVSSKLSSKPEWDSMRKALEDDKIFRESQAQARLDGNEFYKTNKFTGDRSVVDEQGQIRDANYDYIISDPDQYRMDLEQLVNNKEFDTWSTMNLDEMNAAAAEGGQAWVGYVNGKSRKFDKDYIDTAVDQYINGNAAKYRIYLDEAGGDKNVARAKVMNDVRAVANEYTAKQSVPVSKANPGFIKPGTGTSPTDNTTAVRPEKGTDTNMLDKEVKNLKDLNGILRDENADPEQKAFANAIKEDVHNKITDPNTPEGERAIAAYELREEFVASAEGQRLVTNVAQGVSDNVLTNATPGDVKVMEGWISKMMDPDNEADSWGTYMGNIFGEMSTQAGNIVANLFKGFVGQGRPELIGAMGGFDKVNNKGVNKLQLDRSMQFNNIDPIKAAKILETMIVQDPETASEVLGINVKVSSNRYDIDPLNDQRAQELTFTEDTEALARQYNTVAREYKNGYKNQFDKNVTGSTNIISDKVFLSSMNKEDFETIKTLLPNEISNFLPEGVEKGFSKSGFTDFKKKINTPLGDVNDGLQFINNEVSGDTDVYINPAVFGYDKVDPIKLELNGYPDDSKKSVQDMVNEIYKMDGVRLYDKSEAVSQAAKDTYIVPGMSARLVTSGKEGGFALQKDGKDYTGQQLVDDLYGMEQPQNAETIGILFKPNEKIKGLYSSAKAPPTLDEFEAMMKTQESIKANKHKIADLMLRGELNRYFEELRKSKETPQ
jgi:hypothetical protein